MHRGMQFRYNEVDNRGFGVDAVDDDIIHANDQVLFIPDKALLCGCDTASNHRYLVQTYVRKPHFALLIRMHRIPHNHSTSLFIYSAAKVPDVQRRFREMEHSDRFRGHSRLVGDHYFGHIKHSFDPVAFYKKPQYKTLNDLPANIQGVVELQMCWRVLAHRAGKKRNTLQPYFDLLQSGKQLSYAPMMWDAEAHKHFGSDDPDQWPHYKREINRLSRVLVSSFYARLCRTSIPFFYDEIVCALSCARKSHV
jgi:hypothetical protein